MSQTGSSLESMESIAVLRRHAAAGVCSLVVYRKGCGADERRIIEPTHLLSGYESILIRSLQREPVHGLRLLVPSSLVVLEPSLVRRRVAADAFLSEDLDHLQRAVRRAVTEAEVRLAMYVDSVRRVMSDLTIDVGEVEMIEAKREILGVSLPEMRAAHAIIFGEILRSFAADWTIDAAEEEQIERALRCLDELGWAPQT